MSAHPDLINLIPMIDVACLKPEYDEAFIRQTCQDALQFGYAAVFAMPSWIPLVAGFLRGSPVKAGAPIGFPLGTHTTPVKVFETREAVAGGAAEIDVMLNVAALKSGHLDFVLEDLRRVVEASQGLLTKVILETCLLSEAEKRTACRLAEQAGADFVKTSTGFNTQGATAADLRLMRASVSERVRLKAAGGIASLDQVLELHQAGATRFGIGTLKARQISEQILQLQAA